MHFEYNKYTEITERKIKKIYAGDPTIYALLIPNSAIL